MTIAYDSERSLAENRQSVEALKNAIANGVGADFVLRAVLTRPSGELPEIKGVFAEITMFGTADEVEADLSMDEFIERAGRYGTGCTTFAQEFIGNEADKVAQGYVQHMEEALKVS
jgi:hypothetical protein